MALVGVEHLGADAERVEGTHAADAKQDLLAQPVFGVAAVEPVGDLADLVGVVVDVGVEQVERDAAHVGPPHLGVEWLPGEVDGDPHPLAVGESHGPRVEVGVVLQLPAVGVLGLAEVAVAVEEPDGDQGHAEVAGRLEVVAGEDAEATGVLGERLGDAELGREVGDETEGRLGLLALEPPRLREVAGELGVQLVEEPHEPGVGGKRLEAFLGHEAEQAHGVVAGGVPRIGVDPPEQVTGLGVPRPAQVHRQLLERARARRAGSVGR